MKTYPMKNLSKELVEEFSHAINTGAKLGLSIAINKIRSKYVLDEEEFIKDMCIGFWMYMTNVKIETEESKKRNESDFDKFISSYTNK